MNYLISYIHVNSQIRNTNELVDLFSVDSFFQSVQCDEFRIILYPVS